MIYIPILKTRDEEFRIVKNVKDCFGDTIIPLFEIISERYETKYKKDEITGKFLYESKGKRRCKIKQDPTQDDIITLEYINDLIENKTAFIEYFRFSRKKYKGNIDIRRVELAYDLNNDIDLYKMKVKAISKYPNLIPVVTIKDEFDINITELVDLLNELHLKCKKISLRITENWLEKYRKVICDYLNEEDFLLFDIEEQNPESKFMEIDELLELDIKAKIVLINSPRKIEIRNGEYPEHGVTNLINNCARIVASENNLYGFGDYCGLKDAIPLKDGSNGTGAALALLYDYKKNKFHSYANHDTSLGVRGYSSLVLIIKSERNLLDKDGDCPGIKKMTEIPGTGSWSTWHNINASRYIYQVYKNL
ncbi:MAG: hypothetical protein PHX08_14175 [Lachnospiraceae bacterium]|nr:hypothetical protein [Lachnospiraceae bacterium]